jgi:glycosyltransferase involved in cell wall biosynthesis
MNVAETTAKGKTEEGNPRRAMRVAYVVFGASGGMFHYAQQLADAATLEADVRLVVGDVFGGKVTEAHLSSHGITRRVFTSLARRIEKYRARPYKRMADRIVREGEPDIVHITAPSVGLRAIVDRLTELGVAVVYTVHDPMPHDETRTLWGKFHTAYYLRFALPRVLLRCAAIHVHSPKHCCQLEKLYGESISRKSYAVQHGAGLPANIACGTRVPPELQHIDMSIPGFLFFGRIERYKGLDVLFEALGHLEAIGLECNIVVAGQGLLPALPLKLERVRLVCINRFIADEEVRSLFSGCDAVLVPYVDATQSGVVPMAYAFGKPVIASKVGALDEIVIDDVTGVLVPPGNARELADSVLMLAKDRVKIERLAAGATEYMESNLSWRVVARAHLQRYRLVLDREDGC